MVFTYDEIAVWRIWDNPEDCMRDDVADPEGLLVAGV